MLFCRREEGRQQDEDYSHIYMVWAAKPISMVQAFVRKCQDERHLPQTHPPLDEDKAALRSIQLFVVSFL